MPKESCKKARKELENVLDHKEGEKTEWAKLHLAHCSECCLELDKAFKKRRNLDSEQKH